jgi:hypothetical protein
MLRKIRKFVEALLREDAEFISRLQNEMVMNDRERASELFVNRQSSTSLRSR